MKIIPKEEADSYIIYKGKETFLRGKLKLLKQGEIAELNYDEWKGKGRPFPIANRLAKKMGWEMENGHQKDGKGWAFRRVK